MLLTVFLCYYAHLHKKTENISSSQTKISSILTFKYLLSAKQFSNVGKHIPARVNPRPKKIDFFVPSNITFHYTYYRCTLKAILIPAEERSAIFSRHSKLHKHPSYLKNGSSVFHTISILFSPLIITFLITFWQYFCFKLFDFLMQFINPLHHRLWTLDILFSRELKFRYVDCYKESSKSTLQPDGGKFFL